jgi:hypothetical protein
LYAGAGHFQLSSYGPAFRLRPGAGPTWPDRPSRSGQKSVSLPIIVKKLQKTRIYRFRGVPPTRPEKIPEIPENPGDRIFRAQGFSKSTFSEISRIFRIPKIPENPVIGFSDLGDF